MSIPSSLCYQQIGDRTPTIRAAQPSPRAEAVRARWLLAARAFSRVPSAFTLSLLVAAIASLQLVNGNAWALASLPVVFAAALPVATELRLPTTREFFYAYYPAHLAVIAALVFFRGC